MLQLSVKAGVEGNVLPHHLQSHIIEHLERGVGQNMSGGVILHKSGREVATRFKRQAVGIATIMTHQFNRFTLFLQASHCTDARDVQHNGVAPPLFLRDSYAQKKRLALTPPRV